MITKRDFSLPGGYVVELDWLQMLLLSIAQGMCGVFPLSEGGFLTILRKLLGLSLDGSSDGL